MTDDLGARLQRLAGPALRDDVGEFDGGDPVHVDAAARHLLARFLDEDDPEAFELLVEVTEPHVTRAAEAILFDEGGAFPPDLLIEGLYRRIVVDMPPRSRDVRHFLNDATIVMEAHARRLIEEIASQPLPSEGGADGDAGLDGLPGPDTGHLGGAILGAAVDDPASSGVGGEGDRLADFGAYYTNVVNICFHRLDVRHRRALRACDVDFMTPADVGGALGSSEDDALAELRAARRALSRSIAAAFGDGS